MKAIKVIVLILGMASLSTAQPETNSSGLILVRINTEPYLLGFGGKTNITIGTEIDGFVVLAFTPKFEKRVLPSGEQIDVDVSELELKRGDKTITLRKGTRVGYEKHSVQLIDPSDGKNYMIRTGEEAAIGSRRLRLLDVNTKQQTCILENVDTHDKSTIKRIPQPPSAGDVATRAAPEK